MVLALSAASLVLPPWDVRAACVPGGTSIADQISCSGTHTSAVTGLDGNDQITVQPGADVNVGGTGSIPPITAINGGDGNDTIVNRGSVFVASGTSQSQWPSAPAPDPITHFSSAETLVTATAIAIHGAGGDDTLENHASLSATASSSAMNLSMPVTLSGGDVVISTTRVETRATGFAGGTGADTIVNTGQITAAAGSSISNINAEHNLLDATHGDASTYLTADAWGMRGGEQSDSIIRNSGNVLSVAETNSLGVNVEINVVDAATADAKLDLKSRATGVLVGAGGGLVENTGYVDVYGIVGIRDVGVNASFLDITISDRRVSDASTTGTATVLGVGAPSAFGDMTIVNEDTIHATAISEIKALAISLASEGVPFSTGPIFEGLPEETGIASVGIKAYAESTGIAGDFGNDRIENRDGEIIAKANADAQQASINVGISLVDWKIPTPGIVLGSAGTGAYVTATGVDGGAGDDVIENDAFIRAESHANSAALTVSANISGFTDNVLGGNPIPVLGSLGASMAVADTAIEASAASTGIAGGRDNDTILNAGDVEARAESDGGSISIAGSLNAQFKEGNNLFSVNAVAARGITTADSTAIGIDGGTGNDRIINTGNVTADAETDVLNVAAAVVVAGSLRGKGGAANVAAVDTSGVATAAATGITGGDGDDEVENQGSIRSISNADSRNASAALSIGFAKQGLAANVSLARAESIAEATSLGIEGGAGNDQLTNGSVIESNARADALAVTVSVGLSGTADGVSISASLAKADAQATANGGGIAGGDGDDIIDNSSQITVQSVGAQAKAAAISVDISGTNNGLAAGFSLADAGATATATATGLAGNDGNDQLRNSGSILLQQVDADVLAVGVSVSLKAAVNAGVALGAALTDVGVDAFASATGMDGGAGNDTMLNTGSIVATDVQSNANAWGVAFTAEFSMAGAAGGAAFADTRAAATTTVKGMDGGDGDDVIVNRGTINLHGSSEVAASTVR